MKMQKVRTLLIVFENTIAAHEVSAFRGSMVEKVGRKFDLFHNHAGNNGFHYRYPKIQYKWIDQHPGLFCFDAGLDVVYRFFQQQDWSIDLYGRPVDLVIDSLLLKSQPFGEVEQMETYRLTQWQPFNEDNWHTFRSLRTIEDRIAFLERILIGNILSFAKDISWRIQQQIRLELLEVLDEDWRKTKSVTINTFDVLFRTNLILPEWIGLGKGVSKGFGHLTKEQISLPLKML
jgi:hypothetical protein